MKRALILVASIAIAIVIAASACRADDLTPS
jgi:hypothetical protein